VELKGKKKSSGIDSKTFFAFSFISVSDSLPKTSSIKMAEVWMLFSLFLPFLEVGGWD